MFDHKYEKFTSSLNESFRSCIIKMFIRESVSLSCPDLSRDERLAAAAKCHKALSRTEPSSPIHSPHVPATSSASNNAPLLPLPVSLPGPILVAKPPAPSRSLVSLNPSGSHLSS